MRILVWSQICEPYCMSLTVLTWREPVTWKASNMYWKTVICLWCMISFYNPCSSFTYGVSWAASCFRVSHDKRTMSPEGSAAGRAVPGSLPLMPGTHHSKPPCALFSNIQGVFDGIIKVGIYSQLLFLNPVVGTATNPVHPNTPVQTSS